MTRLSSIFSFNTLRGSLWPGSAVLLALTLVGLAEVGVRFLVPNLGWSEGRSSLGQWVRQLCYDIDTRCPEIWLMGNSVLAYGVDVDSLESRTSKTVIALPFGGATVSGATAMLEFFLRRAPRPPDLVVFCITKDDLNLHGERAWFEKNYLEYDTLRGMTFDRICRLADSRKTLSIFLKSFLLRKSMSSPMHPSEPSFKGVVSEYKAAQMGRLMYCFELDERVFPRIRSLAQRYSFDVSVVLMPVTDIYMKYHDHLSHDLSCEDVHLRIHELAIQQGFDFHNLSGMAPAKYEYYSDPFHMTSEGRARATALLAAALSEYRRAASTLQPIEP